MAESKTSIAGTSLTRHPLRDTKSPPEKVDETTVVEDVLTDIEKREALRQQIVEQYPIPKYSSAERTTILNDYLAREAQETFVGHTQK